MKVWLELADSRESITTELVTNLDLGLESETFGLITSEEPICLIMRMDSIKI